MDDKARVEFNNLDELFEKIKEKNRVKLSFHKVVNRRVKSLMAKTLRFIFLTSISFVILLPLIRRFAGSIMTEADLYNRTVVWIARNPTLENYLVTFQAMDYPVTFSRTFMLTITVSLLQVLSCTLVAYGIGRLRFKGSGILFGLVLFTLIVPPQMIYTSLFLNFRFFNPLGIIPEPGLNLIGSFWPFVLTSITATGLRNGLFIYIMRQFFRGMPRDLEEAAYVDGASIFRTFFTIMLPAAVPGLVIVFLFSFVWQWNDHLLKGLFLEGASGYLINALQSAAHTVLEGDHLHLHGVYASTIRQTAFLLFIAPLLLLYAFMQRYFIESVERTGIVG